MVSIHSQNKIDYLLSITRIWKNGNGTINIYSRLYSINLLSQTVSRASSRKSRPESSGSRLERFGPSSDHSESDDEIPHKPREHLPEIADFTTVDINDEKAFDTDLEDKGTSLLLLKGQSIVIMIPKTSPVVFIRKYFIFSNSWCLIFFIECLKEIYANVFYTYSDFYYVPAHSFFRGLRVLSNFFLNDNSWVIKSHRSIMWKLDWFFNEIHLSCFILLNFSLLKQHEPILQPEIKCIGKQLWKQ